MAIYFISDTHFHHKNIFKYEPTRVTATAHWMHKKGYYCELTTEEIESKIAECFNTNVFDEFFDSVLTYHDEMLIDNWNNTVGKNDKVWFLGDLGMGSQEYLASLVGRLQGHKYMVLGNHDNRKPQGILRYYKMGFEYVCYSHLLAGWFLLNHEPVSYINDNYPLYLIYGHVHSSELYQTETAHSRCVCVERTNFRPIQLDVVNTFLEEQQKNKTLN